MLSRGSLAAVMKPSHSHEALDAVMKEIWPQIQEALTTVL